MVHIPRIIPSHLLTFFMWAVYHRPLFGVYTPEIGQKIRAIQATTHNSPNV
jgi:hypothetical protein